MTSRFADWQLRLRWFAAEFLVIVTGVLVAVALNGFYQQRQEIRNEATYLVLLSRDTRLTIGLLEEKVTFEAAQLRDGVAAYRALSAPGNPPNPAEVSAALRKLMDRRTMVLLNATYQDLLSTGNLRLIRNRRLRDQIVEYYGTTGAQYEILNKNNTFMVDELYNTLVVGKGLLKPGGVGNITTLAGLDSILTPLLRGGYIEEPDYLWSLPGGAPEWAQLKTTLVMRIRVAALSELTARRLLDSTRTLSAALDAERNRVSQR